MILKNFFDFTKEGFSGSHPQLSFLEGLIALYHASPSIRNVPPIKKGRKGSSQETADIKLLDPPISPRKGTMQQREALADVRMVNNTDAFITFPILCY
jgi:hypothetical protein